MTSCSVIDRGINEKTELHDCRAEDHRASREFFLTCLILLTFNPMRLISFKQHGSKKRG